MADLFRPGPFLLRSDELRHHEFAVKPCGFGERPTTVRVAAVSPGELAEIDVGWLA